MRSAGLISMGAYVPAKPLPAAFAERLAGYLSAHTLLPAEYTATIAERRVLPGSVETNRDGWESKPWYEFWRQTLPPKKRDDPFQGTKERRRVPLDPRSLRESIHPHPMLAADAETLAGALALVRGQLDPQSIDQVLVASQIPDQLPSTAAVIQHTLRLPNASAYGVDTCCSSFVTMMELAATMVRAGVRERVLIVASHISSHVMDPSEYCCVRLGDAAVAGVVAPVEDGSGYVGSHATANGAVFDAVQMVRRPPTLLRRTVLGPSYEQELVTFSNPEACKEIARNTNAEMRKLVSRLFEKTGTTVDDLALFVTHQPTEWAGRAWLQALEIPESRFYESYERYGNIGCASSGVNLFEALERGRVEPGGLVLMASSGAGETHVGVLERASPALVAATRPV